MSVDLTILYDGDSEALREHRLSVAELGQALPLLLKAIQRTASSIVRQAVDDTYGERGGRFAEAAKRLDLEVSAITDGCVQIHAALVQRALPGETLELPGLDLPERALIRVLEDLDAEAKGQLRNAAVRKYLIALPKSVARQRYVAKRGDRVICDATLGKVNTPAPIPSTPKVVRLTGIVSAVGLEPERETITIRGDGGSKTFSATAALVDRAFSLRNTKVRATAITSVPGMSRGRLLRLDRVDYEVDESPDARLAFITSKWKDALAALAK